MNARQVKSSLSKADKFVILKTEKGYVLESYNASKPANGICYGMLSLTKNSTLCLHPKNKKYANAISSQKIKDQLKTSLGEKFKVLHDVFSEHGDAITGEAGLKLSKKPQEAAPPAGAQRATRAHSDANAVRYNPSEVPLQEDPEKLKAEQYLEDLEQMWQQAKTIDNPDVMEKIQKIFTHLRTNLGGEDKLRRKHIKEYEKKAPKLKKLIDKYARK